jgi:hypothetical protein
LALVLIQRGPQSSSHGRVARALTDRQPRRRGRVDRPQRLDLGAQLRVRVEKSAADACVLGDRREGDARAVGVERS